MTGFAVGVWLGIMAACHPVCVQLPGRDPHIAPGTRRAAQGWITIDGTGAMTWCRCDSTRFVK